MWAGGRAAKLMAGIENPGFAHLVVPGSVADEGRLVHMAGKDDVGLVLADPVDEFLVTEMA